MLQHTCAAQGRKWFRATWGTAIRLCERKSLNSSTRSLSSYRTFNRAVFSASYSVSLRMAEVAKFRYSRDKVVGPCVQRAVAAVQYLQHLLLVAAQWFLTSVLQMAGKFMTWPQMLAVLRVVYGVQMFWLEYLQPQCQPLSTLRQVAFTVVPHWCSSVMGRKEMQLWRGSDGCSASPRLQLHALRGELVATGKREMMRPNGCHSLPQSL